MEAAHLPTILGQLDVRERVAVLTKTAEAFAQLQEGIRGELRVEDLISSDPHLMTSSSWSTAFWSAPRKWILTPRNAASHAHRRDHVKGQPRPRCQASTGVGQMPRSMPGLT